MSGRLSWPELGVSSDGLYRNTTTVQRAVVLKRKINAVSLCACVTSCIQYVVARDDDDDVYPIPMCLALVQGRYIPLNSERVETTES